MTDEQIRIKVAEACGWTRFESGPYNGAPFAIEPGDTHPAHKYQVPNYPADWNACHEMVNSLDPADRVSWIGWMHRITQEAGMTGWLPKRIINSTQRQWCEAFLRVKGLWEDSK